MNPSIESVDTRSSEIERSILVTVEEASGLLHIGRTTAYELVICGVLPSVKIGRRRLVVREGVQKYVDELLRSQGEPLDSASLHSIAPIA
jgi:excisionase family DNA binding protein